MPESEGKDIDPATTASPPSRESPMGPSIQPCRSGPYGELRHQRPTGQKDEGVYLSVCVRDDQNRAFRSSGQSNDVFIYYVPTKTGSHQGHAYANTLGQSSDIHSGGDLPVGPTTGSLSSRVSSKQECAVETSDAQVPLDGRPLQEVGEDDKSQLSHRNIKEIPHTGGV